MPTHETSCVNLETGSIPPGTAIEAAEAVQPVCANLPPGSPSTVLVGAIDNTLGKGRVRATTGAGIAFTLKMTCTIGGLQQVINWPLQPSQVVLGPVNGDGSPLSPSKISKIETVTAGGAPVAPGATVQLAWVRPGGLIAQEGAENVLGVYPGDRATAAAPGRLMPVRDDGRCAARCAGGWAALDDLVVGAGGALRKRAASGDEDAASVGTAQEDTTNGALGQVELE